MLKKYLQWQNCENYAFAIANCVQKSGQQLKGIIAIARGGYIPAVLLAHNMGLRKMVSVCLSSYDDVKQGKTGKPVLFASEPPLPMEIHAELGKGWLIVDDICDTGESLAVVKKLLPQALTATFVVGHKSRRNPPDFWAIRADKNDWIVFPWENENA